MNKQSLKQNLQIFANHFLKPCSAPDEAPNIKDAVLLGGSISGLFIIVAVIWGGLAPIASASIATGVLGVEGKTRIIQHLEGGIVGEILVRNGDNVDAGQVIVRLDDTKARATYDLLSKRRMNTTTLLARLKAEQAGNSKIIFPDALVNSTNPDLQSMVSGQINLFESRRENLANQVSVLKERISEYNTEIVGLEGRIQSGERQLELTREQAGDVKALLKEGLARKPRLLELEVKASEIESRMRHNRAQIARNKTRIQGAKASISETQTKHVFNIADSLRTAESELLDMDERLRAAEDVLTRTAIVAPVSGVVTNLRVNTTGGVITPGEPVADIVPNDELLIVETRVRPDDIDIVRP
ncbi:MAG: HlyD family type I secretion periplasmic adaptor subunit, partial [Rhodospirillaceae bacterium]|nr:HlyD family type I secretion periplasmic adaptor subunit [Rhodospirillaceae bacterium]